MERLGKHVGHSVGGLPGDHVGLRVAVVEKRPLVGEGRVNVLEVAFAAGVAAAGAAGIVAGQIMKSSNSGKEVLESDGKIKNLAIYDEVLSLSGTFEGASVRFGPVFDTRTTEMVFSPKVSWSFCHDSLCVIGISIFLL